MKKADVKRKVSIALVVSFTVAALLIIIYDLFFSPIYEAYYQGKKIYFISSLRKAQRIEVYPSEDFVRSLFERFEGTIYLAYTDNDYRKNYEQAIDDLMSKLQLFYKSQGKNVCGCNESCSLRVCKVVTYDPSKYFGEKRLVIYVTLPVEWENPKVIADDEGSSVRLQTDSFAGVDEVVTKLEMVLLQLRV